MVDHGGTLGTIAGHAIIVAIGAAHIFHGAHGNHIGIVTRGHDGAVSAGTKSVVAAFISSGYNHHNACLPGIFHGPAKRVQSVAFIHRTAQRKIDHANVVLLPVRDGLLNARNHGAVCTRAGAVQNPIADDVCVRRHTDEGVDKRNPGRCGAVARKDARHMGSMAVPITGIGGIRVAGG